MIELRISKSPKLKIENSCKKIVCFDSDHGNVGINFRTIEILATMMETLAMMMEILMMEGTGDIDGNGIDQWWQQK